MDVTTKEVLTAREVAKLLHLGPDKVRRLTSGGIIPGKRIGGECRYIAGMVSPEIAIQKYNQKLGELLSPSPRRQA